MSDARSVVAGTGIAAQTASSLHRIVQSTFYLQEFSRQPGLLQGFDPRAKIVALGSVLAAISFARRVDVLAGFLLLGVVAAALSHIPVQAFAARAWAPVFPLAALLAFPALLTVPGEAWVSLPLGASITWQGLRTASLLLLRIEAAASFSALLVICTPWPHVLKGLRVLRTPVVVVVLLSLTCRYIVLLLQTAQQMFEARESRRVGTLTSSQQRQLAVASIGVLLGKSMDLSEEVYLAMQARGFRGEVFLLHSFHMRARDFVLVAGAVLLAFATFWIYR